MDMTNITTGIMIDQRIEGITTTAISVRMMKLIGKYLSANFILITLLPCQFQFYILSAGGLLM